MTIVIFILQVKVKSMSLPQQNTLVYNGPEFKSVAASEKSITNHSMWNTVIRSGKIFFMYLSTEQEPKLSLRGSPKHYLLAT